MRTMKRWVVPGVAAAFLVVAAPFTANAGRHHHYNGALIPLAVAGAVVGTAAILSAGAVGPAYPAYYGPPPVVYGPPPCAYGPIWVPGRYSPYGMWVPGYYR